MEYLALCVATSRGRPLFWAQAALVNNFLLPGTRLTVQCCRYMSPLEQIREQRNIAAVQKAVSRTLSETYEVETALDELMIHLLQQPEEDAKG